MADMDRCLKDMQGLEPELLNELSAAAVWYRKQAKSFTVDRTLGKVNTFLKSGIKAVPFDKGLGFCLMSEQVCWGKLEAVVDAPQFSKMDFQKPDCFVIDEETRFNRKLMRLFKAGKISQSFYERSRSCEAQPARLYGLTKVPKKDVTLRPVLSLPGSCYENLTNELAKLFDHVAGAGIETSTEKVRNSIAAAELDRDEVMNSLDVKSLYTVPVESIALAAERWRRPAFLILARRPL